MNNNIIKPNKDGSFDFELFTIKDGKLVHYPIFSDDSGDIVFRESVRNDDPAALTVSFGRYYEKLGDIWAISLPAGPTDEFIYLNDGRAVVDCFGTCHNATSECLKYCYMVRLEKYRKGIAAAYARNLILWYADPYRYECECTEIVKKSAGRYFRWNVSGDLPDPRYLQMICHVCRKTPWKKHALYTRCVDYIHQVFDAFPHLKCNNLSINVSVESIPTPEQIEDAKKYGYSFFMVDNKTDPRAEKVLHCKYCNGGREKRTKDQVCNNCGWCYVKQPGRVIAEYQR